MLHRLFVASDLLKSSHPPVQSVFWRSFVRISRHLSSTPCNPTSLPPARWHSLPTLHNVSHTVPGEPPRLSPRAGCLLCDGKSHSHRTRGPGVGQWRLAICSGGGDDIRQSARGDPGLLMVPADGSPADGPPVMVPRLMVPRLMVPADGPTVDGHG